MDNLKGMRVTAFMEIRPICGKALWFLARAVMGASEINDEDIRRICINIWEEEMLVVNGLWVMVANGLWVVDQY